MKTIIKLVGFTAAFALVATAVAPSASAALTSSQIDAIVSLLNSFGADATTVANVKATLSGQATSGSGSTTGSSHFCGPWTRSLTVGSTGADVMMVQKALNGAGFTVAASGAGSPGNETSYFGSLTAKALGNYQAANGISPAVGYFGPITKASFTSKCGSTGDSTGDTTGDTGSTGSTTLKGGAGSVDTYTLVAGYSNEEVGEDKKDVEVAGLEIENSDGSDIEVTAVKLVFAQGTADRTFNKYATDVAIWFKGKKVGSAKASAFTDDNSYTQTISLDSGVILKADETENLILTVSGVTNLDSNDESETWTVDFRSVRFRDAQGSVISEDPSTGTETFSFEDFATAANVELKITDGDDSINKAKIHKVESTTTKTKNVPVFSFDVEVKGSSDVRVDDFSIEATTTRSGATIYIDDLVDKVELYVDGKSAGTATITADENTLLFADLDLDLDAGKTYDFEVRVNFLGVGGALNEGDTLSFTIGEIETDLPTTDIDDENGDALADADITGTASSETSGVFSTFIDVTLVSATASANHNDTAADDDIGTFTMVFDIKAVGGTVYVGDTAAGTTVADGSVGVSVTDAIVYRVYDSGTATTDDLADTVTFTTPNGVTDSTDNIKINDGSTSRVTLTVTQTNDTTEDDGIYFMDIAAIGWGIDDDTTYEYNYIYNLDSFETPTISLN